MEDEEQITDNNPASGLNPRHERFCLEYLKDFNATAAARRAGYKAIGAQVTGSRILALPAAQEFLRIEKDKINKEISLAAAAVNKGLLDITFLERGEFMDENGDLKNPQDLPEHLRAAIQVQTKKIKTDDKVTTITTYSLFDEIKMMGKISKHQPKQGQTNEVQPEGPANMANCGDGEIVPV